MADGVNPADIKKAQETVLESGEEPPAGQQGPGTADQPYDQGNQPEQSIKSSEEPPAGQQGPGTAGKPYDQGNQPEQHSMNIIDQLSRTKTKEEIAARKQRRESKQIENNPVPDTPQVVTNGEAPAEPARGRDHAQSVTASSAPKDVDTTKLAPKPRPQIERSVSPGQLDDGSHVKCSGETGSAYSPPNAFGKIKGKFHIGSH